MRSLDALLRLQELGQPVFQTTDAAACLGIGNAHASKVLARLQESKHVLALSHGRWGIPGKVDILAVPGYLTAPLPSYVSLQTALYHHGMISQIPSVIYAVSLARTRRYATPLGAVSIHHVQPAFFFGFEEKGAGIRLATPEKALIDVLYLSQARSGLFRSLPELELPSSFRVGEARQAIGRIESRRRRTLVAERFEEIWRRARKGRGGTKR